MHWDMSSEKVRPYYLGFHMFKLVPSYRQNNHLYVATWISQVTKSGTFVIIYKEQFIENTVVIYTANKFQEITYANLISNSHVYYNPNELCKIAFD